MEQSKFNFLKRATLTTIVTLAVFSGCAPQKSASVEQASKSISDALACTNVKSKVFDAFYLMIDKDQSVPNAGTLKDEMSLQIDKVFEGRKISSSDLTKIKTLKIYLNKLIDLLLSEFAANPKITWKEQIQKLIEYEMGDRSNAATIQSTESINRQVDVIKELSRSLEMSCGPEETPPANEPPQAQTPPVQPEPTQPPASASPVSKASTLNKGLNMVFSTAYQSCRALEQPEMTKSTPDVDGVERVGTHEDGIGAKRTISSLTDVQRTHYYLQGSGLESNCKDLRSNPLIYDYGGSPSISNNTINFFINSGTGTETLGVDCSAYVSSAIAVAGLRYKPGLDNKPIYIRQTSSKFIDAEKSGFACFENVTVTKASSIKPGDIIGVIGHVLTIDSMGEDPFGLKLLKSETDCSSINYRNFDFVVNQSSPSKNGIGINKYIAKDYLGESSKMKTAFEEMGKQACTAYFQNKSIKPKSDAWGFLRHKGTSDCLAPRVTMVGESCSQKCF